MTRRVLSVKALARARLGTALLAVLLGGCSDHEVRLLETLPGPVFREPPADWPATAPDADRRLEDIEAGWRNHVRPGRSWKWIVIHHSATPAGDARGFDRFHRDSRGWDELGYHFVIGNGTDSPDGFVQPGTRWLKQKHGAHCATPSRRFNELGIGICLVGDFDQTRPTANQWAWAVRLCRFLCEEYGISPGDILGHRDAQATEGEATTSCPGRHTDLAALRRDVEAALAAEARRR